jgi:hypothetical protein
MLCKVNHASLPENRFFLCVYLFQIGMKPEKVDRTTRKRDHPIKPEVSSGAAAATTSGIAQQFNDNLRLSTCSSSSTPPLEALMLQSSENRTTICSPRPDVIHVSVIRKMPRSSPQERTYSCSAGDSGGGRNQRSVVVNADSERRLTVMASPEAAALSCYSSLESESPTWTYLGSSSSPYQLSSPPEAASFGSEVS